MNGEDPEVVEADELSLFRDDAERHLAAFEQDARRWNGKPDSELLKGMFRAAHTLKGSAATIGHARMTSLAHALETLLDALQRGTIEPNERHRRLLWDGIAGLRALTDAATTGCEAPGDLEWLEDEIAGLLRQGINHTASPVQMRHRQPEAETAQETESRTVAPVLTVSVEIDSGCPMPGVRCYQVLETLDAMGSVRWSDPPREQVEAGDGGSRFAARVATTVAGQALVERLEAIREVTNVDIVEGSERRPVPIGPALERLPRIARDLAAANGLQVDVRVAGGETTVDSESLGGLRDVLLQMVRNAIAHGIELPAERMAANKAATGTIEVHAWSDDEGTFLRVQDDGRGIRPASVRQRAVDLGLVTRQAAEAATDAEALEYMFLPGFTTASALSALSGRGVGLDIVADTVAAIEGTVSVNSTPGRGTEFLVRLPIAAPLAAVSEQARRHIA